MSINIDKTKDALDLDLSEVVQLFDENMFMYIWLFTFIVKNIIVLTFTCKISVIFV